MNTTRFVEIAKELGNQLRARTDLNILISHAETDIDARKMAITPEGGWQGKNAEERKLASERAYSDDLALLTMGEDLEQRKVRIAEVETEISCLETERRALEWTIRARLVDALAGKQETKADVAENAFDDAAEARLDEGLIFGADGIPYTQAEWDAMQQPIQEAEVVQEQMVQQTIDLNAYLDELPF